MISVCMATFNGSKYIREQIESILPQLEENDELIISDDGSTDDTIEIIKSFADSRIKIIHHKHSSKEHKHSSAHYHVSENFEFALSHAKGDYIFLSDQDDIWYPQKVKTVCKYLKTNDLVYHNRTNIDTNKRVIKEKVHPKDFFDNKLKNMTILVFTGCQMAISRRLLNYSLPFPKNTCVHDGWIGRLAAILNFKMAFIDTPLIYYRIHSNNVSHQTGRLKSNNPLYFKISYRIKLIFDVLKRFTKVKLSKLSR